MALGPFCLCDEINASAKKITLKTTSFVFYDFCATSDLCAWAIASLSGWTCSMSIFLVIGTLANSFFLVYSFNVWSPRGSAYFRAFLLRPGTVYLEVVLHLFFHLPCFSLKLRHATFVDSCVHKLLGAPGHWLFQQWIEYNLLYDSVDEFVQLRPSFETFRHNAVSSPAAKNIDYVRFQEPIPCRLIPFVAALLPSCNMSMMVSSIWFWTSVLVRST